MLSAREQEVLSQLSLGITNREIAENLCISQATVKTHVLSIFGKLGVSLPYDGCRKGEERRTFIIAILVLAKTVFLK